VFGDFDEAVEFIFLEKYFTGHRSENSYVLRNPVETLCRKDITLVLSVVEICCMKRTS